MISRFLKFILKIKNGTQDGSRTHTLFRALDFKSNASTNSATRALPNYKWCPVEKKEQKFTKPPLRYTDASIVKTMEEKGIGRPSTYATIISKLMQKYVKKDGKYMVPTPIAYDVVDMLLSCFEDIMDVGFTAGMETRLDDIEDGGVEWREVIGSFYPGFERNLRKASAYGDTLTQEVCGKCGHFMLRRMGKFGKYLACSNYPECQNILSESQEELSAIRCPKCG